MFDSSGSLAELDERQMPPALEVMDAELERATCARPTRRRVAPASQTQLKDETSRVRRGSVYWSSDLIAGEVGDFGASKAGRER
jgi:hypothetical protein